MNKINDKNRVKSGTIASLVGIIANLFLALSKILVGAIFGMISLLADGLNNLTDCGSSVISTISFRLSAKPADKEHPYGHERIEYICSLAVAFIILLVAFETIKESIEKIVSPTPITFSYWIIGVLILSFALKFALFFYYRAVANKINSSVLKATSIDSLSDCVSTGVVLISFLISKFTNYNVDSYAGILVSIFIAFSAVNILKDIFSTLIGKAPEQTVISQLKEKILSYHDVLGVHDLWVYSYGPNMFFASVHVEVDANVDVLISHELVDQIEKEVFESTGILLTGHLDPIVTDDPRVNTLREQTLKILEQIDTRFSIHDFRMVFGENRTNVLFDVAIPYDCALSKEQIKNTLEQKISEIDPKYCLIVTVEQCI